MKFNELIIYCDVDGTFLKSWNHNPFPGTHINNLKEIKRFINEGGLLSFASGREYKTIIACLEDIKINMPIVQNNGGAIYDTNKNTILYQANIPYKIKKELYDYTLDQNDIWLVASTIDCIYDLKMNDYRDEGCFDLKRPLLNIDDYYKNDILKLAFIIKEDKMDELKRDISKLKCFNLINGFNSSKIYYEICIKGVDKGKSILKAIDLVGVKNRKLVCIGDHYNDYSMLKVANIKAAPENAIEDIKAIADIITVNNDEGAIADLINKLELM